MNSPVYRGEKTRNKLEALVVVEILVFRSLKLPVTQLSTNLVHELSVQNGSVAELHVVFWLMLCLFLTELVIFSSESSAFIYFHINLIIRLGVLPIIRLGVCC